MNIEAIQSVTSISTMLGLAGLVVLVLFWIVRLLVTPERIRKVTQEQGAKLLNTIIHWIFMLALVAIVLAFVGYVLPGARNLSIALVRDSARVQVEITRENTVFVGSTLMSYIETGSTQLANANLISRTGELNDAQIVLTPKTLDTRNGICLQLNVTSPPGYAHKGAFTWKLAISQAGMADKAIKITGERCDG